MKNPDTKTTDQSNAGNHAKTAAAERAGTTPIDTDSATTPEESTGTPVTQKEHGGPKGLEPTRYGDWESNGRCTDF